MITFKNRVLIIIISLLCSVSVTAFDWQVYVTKYPELFAQDINNWEKALNHYLYYGAKEGRTTNWQELPTSNFDWRYYVHINNLHILNEKNALNHYEKEGKFKNLPFCKSLKIVILLHLYNLDQMDEFIERINYFIQKNYQNSYHIIINIPVDQNIDNFFKKAELLNKFPSIKPSEANYETFYKNVIIPANYASHLINQNNYMKYYQLHQYLSHAFPKTPVQVFFSPNKGRDIGGFFLLLDQLTKQNIEHDFIIKLHTKTDFMWRKLLTSFLNIYVNPILSEKECIYSNRIGWYFDRSNDGDLANVKVLLNYFGLPQRNFYFCGGTMFIVSSKFTDFFRNFELLKLFNMLNDNQKLDNQKDGLMEHAYERLFGYLIDYLGLRTFCLDLSIQKIISIAS